MSTEAKTPEDLPLNGNSSPVQPLLKPEFRAEFENYAKSLGVRGGTLARMILEKHFLNKGWDAQLFKTTARKLKQSKFCLLNAL